MKVAVELKMSQWERTCTEYTSVRGIHRIKQRRQLQQGGIRETLDRPQRMVRWNQGLGIDKRQHARLFLSGEFLKYRARYQAAAGSVVSD
jgi:hypothetical protein